MNTIEDLKAKLGQLKTRQATHSANVGEIHDEVEQLRGELANSIALVDELIAIADNFTGNGESPDWIEFKQVEGGIHGEIDPLKLEAATGARTVCYKQIVNVQQ